MSATPIPIFMPPSYSASTSTATPKFDSYNFIIVGGGTSSLVVATRLTQDPSIRVLMLEAGNDHSTDPKIRIPGLWPGSLGTETDWVFLTEPQARYSAGISMAMNIDPETRERSHALNAYYEPNKARENLIVVTGALVTNLHFSYSKDEKGNAVATSISYTQSHGSYPHNLIATATASKEIILAAGALQTPKLLELSGVGSEGLLRELDIPIVVSNENIGENLQDHTNCGFSFEVAEGIKTMDDLARQKLEAIEAAMGEYATEKKESFATGGKFAGGILPVVEFLGEDGKVEEFKGKYRDDDDRPYRTRSQAAQNTY